MKWSNICNMSPDLSFDWDEWTTASRLGVMSDFKSNLVVVVITSFKLCSTLLLDGWGWWSLSEVNIWVLSDYNGPRLSRLGLTSKSCKNRFHLPQIKSRTFVSFLAQKCSFTSWRSGSDKKMICDKGGVDQGRCWYGAVPIFTESLVKVDKHCLCLVFILHLHNRIFSQLIIESIQSVKIRFHNWL